MKTWIILAICILCNIKTYSVALSDSAEIRLITCSAGKDLYSVFGHSAIRVIDPSNRIDLVFNYGTFDFNTPHFYLKFAKGNLDYMLSVSSYRSFRQAYFYEERSITESILNLTSNEKQVLFEKLVYNSRPENKFYRYDFFFDNCATRIRDVVFESVKGRVLLRDTVSSRGTLRQLYGNYLEGSPWTLWGIHILLGYGADQLASANSEMYLPDYLEFQFRNATIVDQSGIQVPLVLRQEQTLAFNAGTPDRVFLNPSTLFWLLLIIVTYISMKWRNSPGLILRWIDSALFTITGLIGCLLVFLWFFTLHRVTQDNFNLLWAFPLNMVIPFIYTGKFKKIRRLLLLCSGMLLLILLAGWFLIPQQFPVGLFPLTMLLLIRVSMLWIKK